MYFLFIQLLQNFWWKIRLTNEVSISGHTLSMLLKANKLTFLLSVEYLAGKIPFYMESIGIKLLCASYDKLTPDLESPLFSLRCFWSLQTISQTFCFEPFGSIMLKVSCIILAFFHLSRKLFFSNQPKWCNQSIRSTEN